MDNNMEIQFGDVTLTKLLDAQKITIKVLAYIEENKNSQDKEILENVHLALMAVTLNDLLTSPIISSLAKEVGDSIEAEMLGKKEEHHISIKVPVSREKS